MEKGFALRIRESRIPYVPVLMTMVSMVLFVLTAVFFYENIAFFQPDWSALMDDTQFFVTFGVALGFGCLYLFMAKRHFGIGLNPGFFILFLVLFIGNVIGVMMFPAPYSGTNLGGSPFTITFDTVAKIRYIFDFLIVCLLLYCEFAVMPKTTIRMRQASFPHYVLIIVCLVALIVSIVWEGDVYRIYFDPTTDFTHVPSTISFTNNPNTLGVLYLFGMFSAGYLYCRNRIPVVWWVLIVLLFLAMLTTQSRTSILCAAGFLVFFFVHNVFRYVRKAPGRVALSILLAVAIIVTIVVLHKVLPPEAILNRFLDAFFQKGIGSIDSRVEEWTMQVAVLNEDPIRWVFGVGDRMGTVFSGAATGWGYFVPSHNGILAQLFAGGLLRFGIYLGLFGYFVYTIITYKPRSKTMVLCLAAVILAIAHGIGEDTYFLGGETKSVSVAILYIVPVLAEAHIEKHKETINDYLRSCQPKVVKPAFVYSPVVRARIGFFLVLLPIVTIVGGVVVLQKNGHLLAYSSLNLLFVGIAAFILYPACLFLLGFSRSKGRKKFASILYTLLFAGLAVPVILLKASLVGMLIAIGGMVFLLALAFLFHYDEPFRVKEGFLKRALLPNAILFLILLAPYYALAYLGTSWTTYTVMALMLLEFAALLLFRFYGGKKLIYPIPYSLLLLDANLCREMYRNEAKMLRKDREFYARGEYQQPKTVQSYDVHTGRRKEVRNPNLPRRRK